MPRKQTGQPTERELAILRVLWDTGPATVRQVNDALIKRQEEKIGYTTTLKIMQIMIDKGLLVRDDSQFKHIFRPAVSEENTQNRLVADLLDKVFHGSAEKLVLRALSAGKISPRELEKIKKLIDKMEGAK